MAAFVALTIVLIDKYYLDLAVLSRRGETKQNMRSFVAKASVTAVAFLKSCHGFYMPGVRPHEFLPGEEVPMKVNALSSIHTQVSEISGICSEV